MNGHPCRAFRGEAGQNPAYRPSAPFPLMPAPATTTHVMPDLGISPGIRRERPVRPDDDDESGFSGSIRSASRDARLQRQDGDAVRAEGGGDRPDVRAASRLDDRA